jgi:hypothetical protein
MKYTKKELYEALESIGSTNLEEETLVNVMTGEKTKLRIIDKDRNYFWVLDVNEGQYEVVYQSSFY